MTHKVESAGRLTILISDQHLAIEHLVIPEYVVQHFLVQIFRWILESDFHPTSFLGLEVDIAASNHQRRVEMLKGEPKRWLSIEAYAYGFKFSFYQRPLFGLLSGIEYHQDQITCLQLLSRKSHT